MWILSQKRGFSISHLKSSPLPHTPPPHSAGLSCSCARVTGISFWRRTFGKTFSAGRADWKHTASKRIPKALNYLFTEHSSLMRPLLALLFHKHFPSASQHGGLWLVICCLYKASPTHHLDLCCRGSRCIFVSQRPVGHLTSSTGLSPSVHSASCGELGETAYTPTHHGRRQGRTLLKLGAE